jgi:hypothetical protein
VDGKSFGVAVKKLKGRREFNYDGLKREKMRKIVISFDEGGHLGQYIVSFDAGRKEVALPQLGHRYGPVIEAAFNVAQNETEARQLLSGFVDFE